ncbi:hypothetical protein LO771_17190 [Streptacidiphilus sp. ASG 303]|uniref:hypothetical protein n=1 Tax=Streptacidiphilus sp. ASG 303 TaxID=2896847 RepID=UPI001E5272FF|nr:hypothetical protein [Streptacidiphilus sp. ASG 303]MCD0484080.1 hypothetical protein [Streptacidiphilus sp. ASG 303]
MDITLSDDAPGTPAGGDLRRELVARAVALQPLLRKHATPAWSRRSAWRCTASRSSASTSG